MAQQGKKKSSFPLRTAAIYHEQQKEGAGHFLERTKTVKKKGRRNNHNGDEGKSERI